MPFLGIAQKGAQCNQLLKDVPINCIVAKSGDWIWMGTNRGLYLFNPEDGIRTMHEDGEVTAITMDRNVAWTSLRSGKIVTSNRKINFTVDSEIHITSLGLRGNDIWIGTKQNGVYVYDKQSLKQKKHYKKDNSELVSNEVNFLYADKSNAMWIGTSMGLCHIMNNAWKITNSGEKMYATTEKDEEIWFVGNRGLYKVTEGKPKNIIVRRDAVRGKVNEMYFDKDGRLYLASDILSRYDVEDKSVVFFDIKKGFTNDTPLCLDMDKHGDFWVGTSLRGLYRIKADDKKKTKAKEKIFQAKNLYFKDDSYELTYDTKMELNRLISYLKRNPEYNIDIIGYTNGLANEEYCNWLSTSRAKKVSEYIVAYRISKSRIKIRGAGKSNPIATDKAKERNMNQRVEIKLFKSPELDEE